MRKLTTLLATLLSGVAAWAQSSIRVEVHNIVELSERFNLVFVVEGEHAPSDFQWDASDEVNVVWGPQKGTSTSIQMVNGKTTRSSQTSYTYILQAKKTGTLTLPPAVAKVKGNEIHSKAVTIQVVDYRVSFLLATEAKNVCAKILHKAKIRIISEQSANTF